MAVQKIFWNDPYLKELTTFVTSVSDNCITLDETIVYSFSGGQQSDRGFIDKYKIINSKKKDKEIYYYIDENHKLKEGDNVVVTIDWDKRYKIMKLHFAAEIILALVNINFNNPQKNGANITSEKARLDFIWESNISEIFPLLISEFDKLIQGKHDIKSYFDDQEKEIRYWEINGFYKMHCGGTHIKNTSEIGGITLKRVTQGKNKERIEIYLK